jgi:fucose permease
VPPTTGARWATRAQFLNLGLIVGAWGVHVPSVKSAYRLDERMLALVMLATSVGSVCMLVLAGPIVGRVGARNTTVLAGWLIAMSLGLLLTLSNVWWLLPLMVVFGAGQSLYDVAINAEGTMLELMSGRAVMSGFHGMFSVGALIGAGVAALLLRLGVPATAQLPAFALVVALSLTAASRGMLSAHPAADEPQAQFAVPRGALLVTGLLILSAMLAEGVMYNWSVLYVQQELRTPQTQAALAYVAFSGATAAMRFAGDAVRARVSERTMVRGGAMLSAVAMAIALLAANPWVAITGFAFVGVGLATMVPLLYNAATRVAGVSRAAAIASVSSVGYFGFMIGPPIIGAVAHATTLSVAMATLIVACALVMVGASRVPLRSTA